MNLVVLDLSDISMNVFSFIYIYIYVYICIELYKYTVIYTFIYVYTSYTHESSNKHIQSPDCGFQLLSS
jgi:hypothetical protein